MKIAILWVLLSILVISVLANGTRADRIESTNLPKRDLILVSTIDGYLIAVEAETGKEKWRFKEDPVINSPRDALTGFTFIPNPRDGQLYSLEDGDLGKLPYTIPQLVKASPSRTSNGILYAGTKKDIWISINPETGSKMETLPSLSANSYCPVSHPETVFIGRTEYHLSMLDTNNKERTWNASFTDYSSHLLPLETDYPFQHFTQSADGKIMTLDLSSGRVLWKQNFHGIIVNLYLLKSDGLHLLPTHTIGKNVFDSICENSELASEFAYVESSYKASAGYVPENVEKFTNGRLRATLFIGETINGLYALPSIISTTGQEVSKLLGPKIVDRVEPQLSVKIDENLPLASRPQLPPHVPTSMTTYKTVDGEYILLGYHTYPRLVMRNTIQFTDPSSLLFMPPYRIDYDEDEKKLQAYMSPKPTVPRLPGRREPARIQHKPDDSDDHLSLGELLLVMWNSHPLPVMAATITIVALAFVTIYMCGRQSVYVFPSASSREVSVGSHRSRATTEPSTKPWSSIFTRGSKSPSIHEDDTDPSLPSGWRQIGKIHYNPQDVLGQGCEGTIVYKGTFDGREAAVKRVITEAVTFVDREINLLRESDSHPNVIRYFCSESDHNFRFIALELCECTLKDYVVKPEIQRELETTPKVDILRQATEGLLHLHNNNIIHRDIKPHNILLNKNSKGQIRVMISDFGLCKKVRPDAASMSRISGLVGTDGWQAAELYNDQRVTYAVDVFSMGCIYFYVLTKGKHPFGDAIRRQHNILRGEYDLKELAALDTSFNIAALNLIESMIQLKAAQRPRLQVVLAHPMFWTNERQLQFFMDVSDRIEKEDESNDVVQRLEQFGVRVTRNWQGEICSHLREDLRKFRTYKTNSIRDLLRALRNKKHHYRELPELVKNSLGKIPNEYLNYWTSRFPRLLMHIYNAMICCAEESAFATYYPLEAHSFCNRRLQEELDSDFIIAGPAPFLKHTTSTPALPGSPRMARSTSSADNWRQASTSPRGPLSANAAKKKKKKKKAPINVLAPTEESENEQDFEAEGEYEGVDHETTPPA